MVAKDTHVVSQINLLMLSFCNLTLTTANMQVTLEFDLRQKIIKYI